MSFISHVMHFFCFSYLSFLFFFFFNDTATTEIYTLSLHDALPILLFGAKRLPEIGASMGKGIREFKKSLTDVNRSLRSEEHTSELQSRLHLVCRLLLEKKKKKKNIIKIIKI